MRYDAFGENNERNKSYDTPDFTYVRNNLEALAVKSNYIPDQYHKIRKFLNEEQESEEMVNVAGTFSNPDVFLI